MLLPAAREIEESFKDSKDSSEARLEFLTDLIEKTTGEDKSVEVSIAVTYFEKTIASSVEASRDENVWKLYVDFIKTSKLPVNQLRKVLYRSTKVCAADLDTHTEYLQVMEKAAEPFEDIEAELIRLLNAQRESAAVDEKYILYSGFLSCSVRNLRNVDNPYEVVENSENYINLNHAKLMREVFARAISYFQALKGESQAEREERGEEDSVEVG